MAIEHLMSTSPMGVYTLCQYWFDEELEADTIIEVAERGAEQYAVEDRISGSIEHPTISSSIVWIKSRLLERNALWKPKDVHREFDIQAWLAESEEYHRQLQENSDNAPPIELGWARSQYVACQLVIRPINGTAARVVEFEDSTSCPYCKKYFRNRAAQKLHVIDFHLAEIGTVDNHNRT